MIRMRLLSDDIARIQVCTTPDFGLELMSGGALAAYQNRVSFPRLARWQQEVQRRQKADALAVVTGLYTSSNVPGILGQAGGLEVTGIVNYLEELATRHRLTRFNQALAHGDNTAYEQLNAAVAGFRATAVEPYRRRISSAVARTGARTTARAAAGGIGLALSTLHPKIGWNGSILSLDTVADFDIELGGRTLVLRPLVLTPGLIVADDTDPGAVAIGYPTPYSLGAPDGPTPTTSPALSALLGASRAAALVTVAWSPAITTGGLAEALGLSPAAASRHATVLREAGLIDTVRDGPAVRHRPTRLGSDLIADSNQA
jgi:DNA-binding transcriptional ArsR family regulator